MRWGILFAVFLVACSPQVQIVDRVVERVVEVPVERVLFQCFDGSIREDKGACPSPITAAVVQEPKGVSVQELLSSSPKNYWFVEEDGFEFTVAENMRRSGDVVWDTQAKKAWVFLGEVDRKWYVQRVGIAPPMSDWLLPAYLELAVTFDAPLDRARLPQFSKTNLVWQRMQPLYVEGPRDVLERFANAAPLRVETSKQSLRVLKRDISSNQSLHFADGNKTVVLRIDAHYGVPFVVEEFEGFHRVSRRAFIFSEYARNGQESVVVTKEIAGLPSGAVILTAKEWEEYREFQDGDA